MDHPETLLARAETALWDAAPAVRRSPYALRYHICAPSGWINDPNGLVRFGGRYHVFYQHYPYAPEWGPMHWGHASSADLVHWRHEPIALAPDQPYEKGCFSGSAVDDSGTLTLIYTAHDDENPIKETQCVARSLDGGRTFVKSPLNPVIPQPPKGCSTDFRDPKVWRQDGEWKMVLGASRDGRGCVALYTGSDLEHWRFQSILAESDGSLGTVWECPNFCRVDGQDLLIISPMEIPGRKNIAMFGKFDASAGKMVLDHWQDLDLGEDFYAAQVLDDADRTLLFSWMDSWDTPYPTQKDGWAGALTLPRELHVRGGKLYQTPPKELEGMREALLADADSADALREIHSDCMELLIDFGSTAVLTISDKNGELLSIHLTSNRAEFTLPNGQTAARALDPCSAGELRVFVDRCSVECFVNGGDACFTRRIYPADNRPCYALDGDIRRVRAWSLGDAFEDAPC